MNISNKINILMVAPNPDKTLGGMSSVIKNYENSNLVNRVNYTFLATAVDGNKLSKLMIFLNAFINMVSKLVFSKVDIVHIHSASRGSFIRKSYLVVLAKLFRKKVILHIHGAEFEKFYRNECGKFKQSYIKKILSVTDKVIVLGEEWKQKIGEYCSSEIIVLNNAIKIPTENLYNNNSNCITVLGRLGTRKGTFDIIEATKKLVEKYPNIIVNLAGDGEIDKVNLEIKKYGLEKNINVLGWIDENKRTQLLKDTGIYILPSYNEGMPMSILEAMSYGIPVISTDVGSIPTVIKNDENGYIIKPGDIEKLYTLIDKLIQSSEIRLQMSSNNYNKVNKKFSIDTNIEQLLQIYRNTL